MLTDHEKEDLDSLAPGTFAKALMLRSAKRNANFRLVQIKVSLCLKAVLTHRSCFFLSRHIVMV